MPHDQTADYEVGYGKPPRHTRFAKGQSGNPRGRPCGAKNFTTLLEEALHEPVTVTENGGRRKVSKRQAIITQLVNRSATADFRALKLLFDIVRDIERQTEPASPETAEFSEADEKVLEQLRSRFSKGEP
jgi:transcriptional regulator NrdR family protein